MAVSERLRVDTKSNALADCGFQDDEGDANSRVSRYRLTFTRLSLCGATFLRLRSFRCSLFRRRRFFPLRSLIALEQASALASQFGSGCFGLRHSLSPSVSRQSQTRRVPVFIDERTSKMREMSTQKRTFTTLR